MGAGGVVGVGPRTRATHNLALILDERGLVAEAAAFTRTSTDTPAPTAGRGAPRRPADGL